MSFQIACRYGLVLWLLHIGAIMDKFAEDWGSAGEPAVGTGYIRRRILE